MPMLWSDDELSRNRMLVARSGKYPGSLTSRDPSWREQAHDWIRGSGSIKDKTVAGRNWVADKVVGNPMGWNVGAADALMVPGAALAVGDALSSGDPVDYGAAAVAATPFGLAGKVAKPVVKGAVKGAKKLVSGAPENKLVPAIRHPQTGETLYGKPGQVHGDLYNQHGVYPSDGDQGFALGEGMPFLSRDDAFAWVQGQQPEVATNLKRTSTGKLESNDLNRARASVPGAEWNLQPTNDVKAFQAATARSKANHKFGAAVDVQSEEALQGAKMFLSDDGLTGYAIKPDGDLVSVFSSVKGRMPTIMDSAIKEGATKLDAFDTGLAEMYSKYGFKEVDRQPWNPEYAPKNWPQDLGTPDVVYMKHSPDALTKQEQGWIKKGMTPEQAMIMTTASRETPKTSSPPMEFVPFGPREAIQPEDTRISTRFPHGAERTADPLRQHLKIGTEEMRMTPAFAHNMSLIPGYPGFGNLRGASPDEIARTYVEQSSGNLQHLYNRLPGEMKERSPRWYYGANRFSDAVAERHGIPRRSVSAGIAALSPQKDWFMNASLGERAADIMFGPTSSKRTSGEMLGWARGATKAGGDTPLFDTTDLQLIRGLEGKRFSDLTDPTEQAIWMRMYDEAHNPRHYREITPEGELGPIVMDAKGVPKDISWGSFDEIEKTVKLLQSNGDMDTISSTLSPGHKTRSFYNDIELPHEVTQYGGDPVVDTHAIGAGQLRSVSQKDPAVVHNFGSSLQRADQDKAPFSWVPHSNAGFKPHGVKGTYGVNADAIRHAGKALGLAPLQVQSPTWEGIRMRFPQEGKRANMSFNPDHIWKQYERGEISLEKARDLIVPEGSIGLPGWAKPEYGSLNPRKASTYR